MATLRKIGHAYRIDDEYSDGYVLLTQDEMNRIIFDYLTMANTYVNK